MKDWLFLMDRMLQFLQSNLIQIIFSSVNVRTYKFAKRNTPLATLRVMRLKFYSYKLNKKILKEKKLQTGFNYSKLFRKLIFCSLDSQ